MYEISRIQESWESRMKHGLLPREGQRERALVCHYIYVNSDFSVLNNRRVGFSLPLSLCLQAAVQIFYHVTLKAQH